MIIFQCTACGEMNPCLLVCNNDAAVISICQKMEHTAQKYDVSFMDVWKRVLEYHDEWESE